jgi:hypothetical protein
MICNQSPTNLSTFEGLQQQLTQEEIRYEYTIVYGI